MTTQTLELQAVTDEELQAAAGGGFFGAALKTAAKGLGSAAKSKAGVTTSSLGVGMYGVDLAGKLVDAAVPAHGQ